jgi:oxaloacetate decarboxylase alpha subunit
VQSTTRRQLAEIRRPELFDAVIEESLQVREDLGWPIVMTPFAQYIVAQAALNVISGERYRTISNEVVDLLRGDFGPLPGKVNEDLLDRALATPRGREKPDDAGEVTVKGLRQQFGIHLSDEELLLRAVMPAEQVDRMVAARKDSATATLAGLLAASGSPSSGLSVSVSSGDTQFTLNRAAPEAKEATA